MDNSIAQIRLQYRLAKSAEQARIVIDQKLVSFARVYLTTWTPSAEADERKRQAARALKTVTAIRKGKPFEDVELAEHIAGMVVASHESWVAFESARKQHRKEAEKLVKQLPAYQAIESITGFGAWGLVALIGEAGDIGAYPGVRHLYKRLGLAPDDAYERGEKSTGRKIPRMARGRIMGIIADPLLKAKAKNVYGRVYDVNKARHLANGKTKGHAHNLARRAMVKALIHDVHRAWHGQPMDFHAEGGATSLMTAKPGMRPPSAPNGAEMSLSA